MTKHTILFLAANPIGTDRLTLDQEARAIQVELERSGHRDQFAFATRWAAEPLDLLRELRKLEPTVVHFSGHGQRVAGEPPRSAGSRRDVIGPRDPQSGAQGAALLFHGPDGRPQPVSTAAIAETVAAAGASVRVVVLNACYSDAHAEALLVHVDCVVGMDASVEDDAARQFAIGFYGGLGERASVAAAYHQGRAAISLAGLRDHDRPQLKVREGIDADQLVLAAERRVDTHVAGAAPATTARPQVDERRVDTNIAGTAPGTTARPQVDVGILTIRDDEFRAVLDVFPTKAGVFKGKREYTLRHADVGTGERYTLALLRQIEQGHGEAQNAVRDLIEDLAPRLVLVVGIAGGLPSDDVTLGDVVLGTRIHDFTVEAREAGREPTYAAAGGPIDKALAAAVANLAGREDELGDWTAGLPAPPPVAWTRKGQLYGPTAWRTKLRAKLEHHHGKRAASRRPVYVAGPIASSDKLVKDPTLLFPWITTARNILAVEMESGGVYRAAQERCPMLAIRGISDIVGLQRADGWTKFACASAAAFARAFLGTRPIPAASSPVAADPL